MQSTGLGECFYFRKLCAKCSKTKWNKISVKPILLGAKLCHAAIGLHLNIFMLSGDSQTQDPMFAEISPKYRSVLKELRPQYLGHWADSVGYPPASWCSLPNPPSTCSLYIFAIARSLASGLLQLILFVFRKPAQHQHIISIFTTSLPGLVKELDAEDSILLFSCNPATHSESSISSPLLRLSFCFPSHRLLSHLSPKWTLTN